MYCESKDLPQIFLGIREYIKECYELAYEEEPNYEHLLELINLSFLNPVLNNFVKSLAEKYIIQYFFNEALAEIQAERVLEA